MGYNPGDVIINNLSINSPRTGTWNLSENFLSASIMETIFTPGVMAEIKILDYKDDVGNYQLAGDELVTFNFTKPNGATGNYSFHLNNIKDTEIYGALKVKTYKLICISRETLTGQTNTIQKAFNTNISSMVQEIFGQLGSSLNLSKLEQTQGIRNLVISNQPLFEAIEMLRKEAISTANKSSNFMFYQNGSGFNFHTIEDMLNNGDVKNFVQTNTVPHNMFSNVDNNILAWQILQNIDAMNRIKAGVINQRVMTFNTHTHEFKQQDFKNPQGITEMGSIIPTVMSTFLSLFANGNRPVFRYINPNMTGQQVPKSSVPETMQNKMVNLAQMQEQTLLTTVLGDPVLMAGKTIFCDVPKISVDVNPGLEQQMYGRWLISKLTHEIQEPTVKPRYLCNIEALKGAQSGG